METSTFMEEWQKTLENPQHTDVVFVVESKHRFKAHKLVLCSAAEFFCKVLGIIATEEVCCQFDKNSTDLILTVIKFTI